MNIEIERKYLLKAIPKGEPIETIEIFQWYLKNSEGIWERARSCYSDVKGFYFVHTIKKNIAPGINEEDEKTISSEEFNQLDMSIVERDFNKLLEWENGIHEEYKAYGDMYKMGRLQFLESLLDKYPHNTENLLKLIDWVKTNY